MSIFHAQTAFAQKPDSITHHYDSLSKIKLSQLDSNNNRLNNKIDSAQLRLNNILNPNFNKLSSKIRTKTRTIRHTRRYSRTGFNETRALAQDRQPQRPPLNLPTDRYTHKLDSLNKISPQKYIDMANAKVQSVESKINQPVQQLEDKVNKPINNVENKINDKLNVMRQEEARTQIFPVISIQKTFLSIKPVYLPIHSKS